jgi:transcriptional regulator with XRE-family HTH domain
VGIHQVFAANLRERCKGYSSIADACRAVGINRQQFNKYLSGAMLPNARSLKRICEAFGIEDWELFTNDHRTISQKSPAITRLNELIAKNRSFHRVLELCLQTKFRQGTYKCFFPLPGMDGCLVGSVLSVSNSSGFTTFTRHTLISSPSDPQKWLAYGKHRGIVMSNGTYDFLIAHNTVSPNNMSLMCLPRDATGGIGTRVGLAIVQGGNPLVACRFAIAPMSSELTERKKALKLCSIIHAYQSGPEKTMADILHSPQAEGSAQLALSEFDKLFLQFKSLSD